MIYNQRISSARSGRSIEADVLAEEQNSSCFAHFENRLGDNIMVSNGAKFRKANCQFSLSVHLSKTLKLAEDIEAKHRGIVAMYYCTFPIVRNVEDTRPRQTEIAGRRRKNQVCDRCNFVSFLAVASHIGITVDSSRTATLSLESRNAVRNNVTVPKRNIGRAAWHRNLARFSPRCRRTIPRG